MLFETLCVHLLQLSSSAVRLSFKHWLDTLLLLKTQGGEFTPARVLPPIPPPLGVELYIDR